MDNTRTASLAAAIYYLNNAEKFFNAAGGTNEFGCDIYVNFCGIQDSSHWSSYGITYLSFAYSLVRSEMSAGERTTFVRKMLNDVTTNYGEGGCDNQLQRVNGAVASYSRGTTTVIGSGMAGITKGASLLFKPRLTTRGGWAVVTNVTDTTLTLAAPIKEYSGSAFQSFTNGMIFELGEIGATTCGAVWQAGNHEANHSQTFGQRVFTPQAEAIDTTETAIDVVDASVFPTPPFVVSTEAGEYMRVTAVNGNTLTVTRGHYAAGVGLARNSGQIIYNKMHPKGATNGDTTNNRVLLKTAGQLAAALAGLDEQPTQAEFWIEQAALMMRDYGVPRMRQDWTGFTHGGSYYHHHINTPFAAALLDMLRHLSPVGGAPSLDFTGDNWLKWDVYGLLYNARPNQLWSPISWGTEGIAEARGYFWTAWVNAFYPSSDEAKYVNYWLTTQTRIYTRGKLNHGVFRPMTVWSLLHMPTTITASDYRTPFRSTVHSTSSDRRPGVHGASSSRGLGFPQLRTPCCGPRQSNPTREPGITTRMVRQRRTGSTSPNSC